MPGSTSSHEKQRTRATAAGVLPREISAFCAASRAVWVFAYGSLMWNPEIPCAAAHRALLRGYHRSLCVYSYDYRGSRGRPGLVLGLDRGGACCGLALRLPQDKAREMLAMLWSREMTDRVYNMRLLPLRLGDRVVSGFAFVVRRDHHDYAGRLSPEEAARLIVTAAGSRGSCRD